MRTGTSRSINRDNKTYRISCIFLDSLAFRSVITHIRTLIHTHTHTHTHTFLPKFHAFSLFLLHILQLFAQFISHRTHGYVSMSNNIQATLFLRRGDDFKFLNVISSNQISRTLFLEKFE